MELDHVFCFVPSQVAAECAVDKLGLTETYRRDHPGQGTRNICCCFDNAFVEFLWLARETEARAPPASRMGLVERSQSEVLGTCPFGIAWRGSAIAPAPAMWSYRPSYLPSGMEIAVAEESDDHRLPLVFQSPAHSAPLQWPAERRGGLQHARGYCTISDITLNLPIKLTTNTMLKWLADNNIISIAASSDNRYELVLNIGSEHGSIVTQIRLPVSQHLDH